MGSGQIVRAGAGGLALIGDFPSPFEGGPVGFFPLDSIPALSPVSPGPVTTSDGGIHRLALPNVGLSQDRVSGRLLASVPDSIPGIGNSIVPIDAATLAPGTPVWMGSRPLTTAISDDGQYLYEGFAASSFVQRLDLRSMVPDFAFPLYSVTSHFFGGFAGQPILAGGLLAFPGASDTVAVALAADPGSDTPSFDAVVVYDHGVARPDYPGIGVYAMQWDSTATIIYGSDTADPGLNMARLQPTATGIKLLDTLPYVVGSYSTVMQELRCQNDVCFDGAGDILDGRALKYLGHCPLGGPVLPDVPRSRAWYLAAIPPAGITGSPSVIIQSCDLATFQPAESISISVSSQYNPIPVELLFADPDTFVISTGNEVITAPRSGAVPAAKTPKP